MGNFNSKFYCYLIYLLTTHQHNNSFTDYRKSVLAVAIIMCLLSSFSTIKSRILVLSLVAVLTEQITLIIIRINHYRRFLLRLLFISSFFSSLLLWCNVESVAATLHLLNFVFLLSSRVRKLTFVITPQQSHHGEQFTLTTRVVFLQRSWCCLRVN